MTTMSKGPGLGALYSKSINNFFLFWSDYLTTENKLGEGGI